MLLWFNQLTKHMHLWLYKVLLETLRQRKWASFLSVYRESIIRNFSHKICRAYINFVKNEFFWKICRVKVKNYYESIYKNILLRESVVKKKKEFILRIKFEKWIQTEMSWNTLLESTTKLYKVIIQLFVNKQESVPHTWIKIICQ